MQLLLPFNSFTTPLPVALRALAVQHAAAGSVVPLVMTIGVLLAVALIFRSVQNSSGAVGGPISLPKALWLHCAITMFYIMPYFLWRDDTLSTPVRTMYGWLLFSFIARGVVELIVIYATRAWKCMHGISHNAFTLLLAIALFMALPQGTMAAGTPDSTALWFLPIYIATLVFESINAWKFSHLADPSRGIYFADSSAHFNFINRLTWLELAILWPLLCAFIAATHSEIAPK